MGDGVLLLGRHFGRGEFAVKGIGVEERVVAKAIVATRLVADLALAAAVGDDFRTVRIDEHERADEARRALVIGHVGHEVE